MTAPTDTTTNPYQFSDQYGFGNYKQTDQFLLDGYSGKGGFVTGLYLDRHPRESDDKFKRRRQGAVYPNFTRKIVDVFMGFLWRNSPNRTTDDLYAQFMKNADGKGGKLDTVLSSFQRLAMILGTVFIIVDRSSVPAQTRADQTLPYLVLRMKSQLVDEQSDVQGLTSITFSELDNDELRYRNFTRTEWKVSRDKEGMDVVAQGVHNLGRVPVVRLHIAKPLNPSDSFSQSWVYDLVMLNWELFNLRSELRDLERGQTFAILAMPVVSDAERAALKNLTIGTENGLPYNPTGGGKPEFISPPSEPTAHYMNRIAAVIDDLYRVANLEFVGGVQQSGVALSFHFQEANSSLRGMAEMCESAECEVAILVYLWMAQVFEGNISYANDFNLTDLAQAIAVAMDSVTLGMGSKFDKAIKKRTAKQILGNDTSPTVMKEIDDEIDAGGDIYGNRMAQQAGA
ncbi:phage portal protein [Methylovulum psychrotolerans]|uniref:DUF4055 domain-containing protein n=1 Tax=Methylovulum psychrotolerans TaxID=1704499 RepID=A0A1Z4C0E4_9GAMM|nr:hypothetical protein [Methylovulum psychrotolerans]ASF47007.1 hypothetical protein CEK71_13515 [Methylovulum psychrotolerans]